MIDSLNILSQNPFQEYSLLISTMSQAGIKMSDFDHLRSKPLYKTLRQNLDDENFLRHMNRVQGLYAKGKEFSLGDSNKLQKDFARACLAALEGEKTIVEIKSLMLSHPTYKTGWTEDKAFIAGETVKLERSLKLWLAEFLRTRISLSTRTLYEVRNLFGITNSRLPDVASLNWKTQDPVLVRASTSLGLFITAALSSQLTETRAHIEGTVWENIIFGFQDLVCYFIGCVIERKDHEIDVLSHLLSVSFDGIPVGIKKTPRSSEKNKKTWIFAIAQK